MFGALILAALAGLLGHGPLSSTTAGDPAGPIWIEYNRFQRYQGPSELKIHLSPAAVRQGEARVWIERSVLDHIEIERIEPRPERMELGPDRHALVFLAPQLTGDTSVIIRYLPDRRFGWTEGEIGIGGGPPVPISQFVYP
ncbi:MAG TPA: hypothetical protein VGN97_17550 [Mesorhizobium sp.]|nr:hypothetical protein [Mesorhizobium sp.]